MRNTFVITLLLLTLLVTGCSKNVKMHQAELVRVNLIEEKNVPQYLYLSMVVEGESIGGTGLFENTIYFTLLPGKYVKVATGNGGAYYNHEDNGLKMKNGLITENRFGGFKMPISSDSKWLLWHAPNYAAFFVPTGATEEDFVERIEIPDLSTLLVIN